MPEKVENSIAIWYAPIRNVENKGVMALSGATFMIESIIQNDQILSIKENAMVSYQHQGRLVTHVERKSRYLLTGKAINGTAASFNEVSLLLFQQIPRTYRKTLTLDNGSENTNGLLRRFFPKGTNFLKVTNSELEKAAFLLNHRPRKCLKYRTPFEVFNSITGGALGN